MLLQIDKKYYSREEYLEFEETATERHEYFDGEIITMAGGTTNHNQICVNFCRHFPLTIDNQDYYTYMEGVCLWLPKYNFYTYPDVMVIKGKPVHEDRQKSTVTNPQIIIEVLSKSTQGYDRGDKFQFYRSLSSFQEYILIDQDNYGVEQYFKRSEKQWLINFYTGANAVLKLVSVNWKIPLQQLYQRINFDLIEE